MASAIDDTKPITGNPTTASVRANFTAAKNEIEALQAADISLDSRVDALEAAGGGSGVTSIPNQLSTQWANLQTITTPIPADDTIPQNNEGDELSTISITPTDAAAILEITALVALSPSALSAVTLALFKDSGADALAAINRSIAADNSDICMLIHREVAGSTAARTYKLRAGQSATGTLTINGWGGNRKLGGVMASSFSIKEIVLP